MGFKKDTEFAEIEHLIHRARVERAVVVSRAIVEVTTAVVEGAKRLFAAAQPGRAFEREHVASDPFLERSVPKY